MATPVAQLPDHPTPSAPLLRWMPSPLNLVLAVLLLCAVGIAWWTGEAEFRRQRAIRDEIAR